MISYHNVINAGPWLLVQVYPKGLGMGGSAAFMELLKFEIESAYLGLPAEERGHLLCNGRFPSRDRNCIHSLLIKGGTIDPEELFVKAWENLRVRLKNFFEKVIDEVQEQKQIRPEELSGIRSELERRSRENGLHPVLNWFELLKENPEQAARMIPFSSYEQKAISELVNSAAMICTPDAALTDRKGHLDPVDRLFRLQNEYPNQLNDHSCALQAYKLMTAGGADPETMNDYLFSLQENLEKGLPLEIGKLNEDSEECFWPETMVLDSRTYGDPFGEELLELLYCMIARTIWDDEDWPVSDDWDPEIRTSRFRLCARLRQEQPEGFKFVLSLNPEDGSLKEVIQKAASGVVMEDSSRISPAGDGLIHGNPWQKEVWPRLKSRTDLDDRKEYPIRDWIAFMQKNPKDPALFMDRRRKVLRVFPKFSPESMAEKMAENMDKIRRANRILQHDRKARPGDCISWAPGSTYSKADLEAEREEDEDELLIWLHSFDPISADEDTTVLLDLDDLS